MVRSQRESRGRLQLPEPGAPTASAARGRALNWGSFAQTTTVNPAVLKGWGVRNRDWQYGVSVQQEIAPQVSLDVSYNRRVWSNFFVTHNRALTAADFNRSR